MMSSYAVFDGEQIVNVIEAETIEDAEEATSMTCYLIEDIKIPVPGLIVVQIDEEDVLQETTEYIYPSIGWKKINDEWVKP